ncbi:MAG: hypothetical protein ACI4Q3_01055 [Kiritimatiellia bacterium]
MSGHCRIVAGCGVALACVVGSGSVLAATETAVFAAKGSRGAVSTLDLFTDSNWEGGTAPAFTNINPAVSNTIVDLSSTPTEAKRLAEIAAGSTESYYGRIDFRHSFNDNTNAGMYLHSLKGGPWTCFVFDWSDLYYPLHITDPSTYEGYFDVRDRERGAFSSLYLQAAPDWTPEVNRLCVMGAPNVLSPDGTRSIVKEAFGPGQLNVNKSIDGNSNNRKTVLPTSPSGTVEIMNQPGPLTDLRVWKGKAVLHGVPDDTPDAPAGEPAIRLDASKADSFSTTLVDGVAYVDEWRDADGRPMKVVKNADGNRPRLDVDGETSAPVVNFGAYSSDGTVTYPELGQSGVLTLSPAVNHAREIHVVFRDQFRGSPMPQIVGNYLGEWTRDWLRSRWNRLFSYDGFCDTPVFMGHVLFDGQSSRADLQTDFMRRLNVVSSSLKDHAGKVSFLGASSPGAWQGGAIIAEILVYTNELTVAERQQTHRYLMRKWRPDDKIYDYGVVNIVASGAEVEVADGTLVVRELILPAGTETFVKKGAGTLVLSRVSPANVKIRVEEGSVAFGTDYVPTDEPQLAADPSLHFDASRHATDIETTVTNESTVVSVWHDVRGKGVANSKGDVYTLRKPSSAYGDGTIQENVSPTGLAMVDLGEFHKDDKTGGSLCFWRNGKAEGYVGIESEQGSNSDQRHREGFLVYMKTDDQATALSSMSWCITKMASNAGKIFLSRHYSYNRLVSGYWSYDGNWIDPDSSPNTKDEVHVVAFRASRPVPVNAFAIDRGNNQTGGVKIGEVVYYDRPLTAQERRDTELYLLKKWKGVTSHPQDALQIVQSVDVDDTATIDVGRGETVKTVVKTTSALVKKGEGTVEATVPTALKEIAAEDGVLQVSGDFLLGAAFHADAADLSSMEYSVDANNQTNVTKWGGATAATSYRGYAPGKPRLTALDVNGIGHVMPFVDMLDQVKDTQVDWLKTNGTSSATAAAEYVATGAAMVWPDVGPLEEFHIVLKDKTTEKPWNEIIGFRYGGSSYSANCSYCFLRQETSNILNAEWASGALWNGYIGLNGEKVKPTTPFGNDVSLVSFVPREAITNVFAFATRELNYRIGGQYIGECIAYSKANTEKNRALIETYLRKKWLNAEVEYPGDNEFFDLDSIGVANGATVSFASSGWVTTAAVSGGGTVAFPNGGGLRNVTTIDLAFRDVDDYDTLAVVGTFDVAETGVATVTVDADAYSSSWCGKSFTMMTADEFANFGNFANWTLKTDVDPTKNIRLRLRAVADTGLVLDFMANGLSIIVR